MKSILTILSISLGMLFWFIPSNQLFQTFMPRSVCMFHEQRLIVMHGIADGIIFISYMTLSICLFKLYDIVKERKLPLKAFIWMFGIFILFCGLTHFMGVLNLWITYYWLDGAIKVICAIFSCLVAINFLPAASMIKDMRTEEEYKHLEDKYQLLADRLSKLEGNI